LAKERLEERIEHAEREPDDFLRQRRLARLEVSRSRNGLSRWEDYLSAVKNLRLFAESVGVRSRKLPKDPTKGLHGSADRISRFMLQEQDLDLVWRAARSRTDPELAWLVLNFIRETAARRGAVINLNLGDIHWSESTATLRTKGGTSPTVIVSGDTLAEIAHRAIQQGWDGKLDSRAKRTPAFATSDGKRLTRRWFDGLHRHIQREIGEELPIDFTVHWLRHTTIAQVERIAGHDVAAQWAGHRVGGHGPARGNATSIYVRWTPEESKALFSRMFPKTPPRPVDPELFAEVYREDRPTPDQPRG
jgi:integrase